MIAGSQAQSAGLQVATIGANRVTRVIGVKRIKPVYLEHFEVQLNRVNRKSQCQGCEIQTRMRVIEALVV